MIPNDQWKQVDIDMGSEIETSHQSQGEDYPTWVFPDVAKMPIKETGKNIKQAPISMIGSIYLGAMSQAVQGLFDVSPTNGRESPTSCYILVIAESGTGKSPVFKRAFKAFYKFQNGLREFTKKAQAEYKSQYEIWKKINTGLIKLKTDKAIRGICHIEEDNRLNRHKETEPNLINKIQMIYEDSSEDALKIGLNQNGKSISIATPEGGGILTDAIFKDLTVYLKLWSGESIEVSRISRESFSITDARCTILICTQPEIFGAVLKRKGKDLINSGFLARSFILLAEPKDITTYSDIKSDTWEYLPAFHNKVTELLEKQYPGHGQLPTPERQCLTFSPDAENYWLQYENKIRQGTAAGGFFEEFPELAAKIPDNIARIAAIFHVFDGSTGQISLNTLKRAIQLCCWYAEEYVGVFSHQEEQQRLSDVELLENWLKANLSNSQNCKISKNLILQYGPSVLRKKIRLDAALEQLCNLKRIVIFTEGKRTYISHLSGYYSNRHYGYN